MLPLYLLGFGGIMHADALDGFEGYSMIIFPPTIVSVLFCVWIYRRLDKSKNADADAMPLDDKPKTQ
jgi:cbb3-type cytochrome oxidase subunit 3